jgi:class 3 adenylate cyclase
MAESRKLAAILAANVVGFSRLAGADEDRTLARLRALRSDLIDPTIAVHHGRVVKRTGELSSNFVASLTSRDTYVTSPLLPIATELRTSNKVGSVPRAEQVALRDRRT